MMETFVFFLEREGRPTECIFSNVINSVHYCKVNLAKYIFLKLNT
jgi:hypothetical protein